MIENGKLISVHYTGKTNGEVFDSSEGREPLTWQIGTGQMIPGFEKALMGKKVGDKFNSGIIPPNEAYGEVIEDRIVDVPKDKMPGEVEVGMILEATGDNGNTSSVRVVEIGESTVKIDANHQLAGKEIEFDIEVVDIQDIATEQ